MATLPVRRWTTLLDDALAAHHVPGASVAAASGGETVAFASGFANARTGAPVTPFLIGSISKVWTATLAMQLVDRGLIELDAPVARYLPAFGSAQDEALLVRHLLSHTSGLDEDLESGISA